MPGYDSKKYIASYPKKQEYGKSPYVPAYPRIKGAQEIEYERTHGHPLYVPAYSRLDDLAPLTSIKTMPNNRTATQPGGDTEPWFYRTVFESQTMGNIVVYYYVPKPLESGNGISGTGQFARGTQQVGRRRPRRLAVAIHGAGAEHYTGTEKHISNMGLVDNDDDTQSIIDPTKPSFADLNNTIIIAPCFDQWYRNFKLAPNSYPDGYLTGYLQNGNRCQSRNKNIGPWNGRPFWVHNGPGNDESWQEDWAYLYSFFMNWYWTDLYNRSGQHWDPQKPNDPPSDEIFKRVVADWGNDDNLGAAFYYTIDWLSPYRADLILNSIVARFQEAFAEADDPVENKFMLYGHSGGAQFVSHYMLMWPENLAGAAFSSAGHFLFPRFDFRFPFGLLVDIDTNGVLWADNGVLWPKGPLSDPRGDRFPTSDLTRLQYLSDDWTRWHDKLRQACTFPKIVTCGGLEAAGIYDAPGSYPAWQGQTVVDKTVNYCLEMNRAFKALRQGDPGHWPSEAIYDNVTMFTNVNEDHPGNLTATWNCLKNLWLDFPGQFPYEIITQNSDGSLTTEWAPPPAGPDTPPGAI